MRSLFSRRGLLISALALLLLVILFAVFVDWDTVIRQLQQVTSANIALASIFLVIGYVAFAIRWRLLLENKAGFRPVFHSSNSANLVNTLLPLRPGDAARIFVLGKQEKLPLLEVTSSIVVERWFEQIMRLAAIGGAFVYGAVGTVSLGTIVGSILFLLASLIFMLWLVNRREFVLNHFPHWLARLPRLTEERAYRGLDSLIDGLGGVATARKLARVLLWSVITWALFWAYHYLCLMALNPDIPLNDRLALSLGSLALVPPSAATLPGVFQVSMVVPLSLVGYDQNLLTSYALVLNIFELAWIIGLGVWGAIRSGVSIRQLIKQGFAPAPEAGDPQLASSDIAQ